MANPDRLGEDLNYDFDSRSNPYYPNQSWSIPIDQMESMGPDVGRNISPLQTSAAGLRQTTMAEHPMMDNWRFQQIQQQQQQQQHHQQTQRQQPQPQSQSQQVIHQQQHQSHSHLDFDQPQHALEMSYDAYIPMPSQMVIPVATSQPTMAAGLQMDQHFTMPQGVDNISQNWPPLRSELVDFNTTDLGLPLSPYQHPTGSPTGSHTEVLSQQGSTDETWTFVSPDRISMDRISMEPFDRLNVFVDPNALHSHPRTFSDSSSYSDLDQSQFMKHLEMGPAPAVYSPGYSPTSFSDGSEYEFGQQYNGHIDNSVIVSRHANPNPLSRPIAIPTPSKASSPDRSPGSAGSAGSPGRPGKPAKKSPIAAKTTDNRVSKKTITNDKLTPTEKRVGRRKGPLKPEQRKQASEIRKLRACLRCKFLKKTCDKGDPCSGCQPSHARLWQVPCTRIDIKEIGYFLKDRRFDYERHVSLGFSIGNIKGFSDVEKTLFITHGYGHMLPVTAREVYVRDDKCLKMDWIEANRDPNGYEVATAKLSAGTEGISTTMLSDYLDRHIDGTGTFEKFVDDYFEGTPFLSQMLKVAYRFYFRTNSRIIKKALKLMLAYSLTLHITMVEGIPNEAGFVGKIEDESSRFYGKTMAPVMINFQIKCAMADMWRELHKDVLEELSALYSSVYSGDKLKNWPTIFILASVLLAVWECMQFDCNYRVPDETAVNKFCTDMETTPVGVIVGLFSAISQKLPSILEWDTNKHHTLLASNPDVCDTMTEVRDHVTNYENYLRDRPNAKFDSKDFDSLSNKFLSRLVLRDIRAN